MIKLFKIRVYFKKLINYIFSANRKDVRERIKFRDIVIDDNINYIVNSSVIIRFINKGKEYYFRECYLHQPLKLYLRDAIKDYCRFISKTVNPDRLLNAIENDLKVNENYKKYTNIPEVFDNKLFFILSGEFEDYSLVGLPSFSQVEDHEEFLSFLKYSGAVISTYMANSYVKNGCLENGNSNKQVSTYILSKILGVNNIIPKVEIVEICMKGKMRIGTLMEKAAGTDVAYIQPKDRPSVVKNTFLRDLTNLEYLDALCYQLDHRLDNYNVVCDIDGKAVSVVAFDNDASRTFFPIPFMPRKTYAGASSILKDGIVNRPYMDYDFAQAIERIKKDKLEKELSHYLTFFQLNALWWRIKLLKKAISKTCECNPCFLVKKDKWAGIDENRELDLKYGKTYYYLYKFDSTLVDREIEFKKRKQCI